MNDNEKKKKWKKERKGIKKEEKKEERSEVIGLHATEVPKKIKNKNIAKCQRFVVLSALTRTLI